MANEIEAFAAGVAALAKQHRVAHAVVALRGPDGQPLLLALPGSVDDLREYVATRLGLAGDDADTGWG